MDVKFVRDRKLLNRMFCLLHSIMNDLNLHKVNLLLKLKVELVNHDLINLHFELLHRMLTCWLENLIVEMLHRECKVLEGLMDVKPMSGVQNVMEQLDRPYLLPR